jgi:hypothetical protein
VLAVYFPEAFGEEAIQGLSDGLGGRTAKHPFRGGVEQDDAVLRIDGDDGVHRRGEDAGVECIRFLENIVFKTTVPPKKAPKFSILKIVLSIFLSQVW